MYRVVIQPGRGCGDDEGANLGHLNRLDSWLYELKRKQGIDEILIGIRKLHP